MPTAATTTVDDSTRKEIDASENDIIWNPPNGSMRTADRATTARFILIHYFNRWAWHLWTFPSFHPTSVVGQEPLPAALVSLPGVAVRHRRPAASRESPVVGSQSFAS